VVQAPAVCQAAEGEELEYDPSAYVMYHSLRPEWPCLSFDVVRDQLGNNRTR
jgi:ribosome assembly protein RRB1